MSNQPSDQRSYSVDEMMERLRDGEREKRNQPQGEMVTRPDGTQVMRVRKRKRRTRQPKAEAAKAARRQKKVMVVFCAIAIAVLLVLGVVMLMLLAKLNSKGYQEELETRIGGNVGGTVAINRLSVTPLTARAKNVKVEWGQNRFLQELGLVDLSADVGLAALLGADWNGDLITARSGRLQIGQVTPLSASAPGGEAEPLALPTFQCAFFSVEFGDRKESGALLKNSDVTLRPDGMGGSQIIVRGGILDVAGWPPLEVDTGLATSANGVLDLVALRATAKDGIGEAVFRSVEPIQPGRTVVLGLELTDFPFSNLAGMGLDRLVGGTVSCESGTINLKGGTLRDSDLRVEFDGTEGSLSAFPFLENMRVIFGDTDYLRPTFEVVRGVYRRTASGTELQRLEMEDPGQMMVRGTIAVSHEGALSGRLDIGIPQSKVIRLTGQKRWPIFSDPESGFCWIEIELDGTTKDPGDNFKVLLQNAAQEAADRRNSKGSGGSRFDELTR